MKTFIVAEGDVDHSGDEKISLALAEAAAEGGADGVNFDASSAHKLMRRLAAIARKTMQCVF